MLREKEDRGGMSQAAGRERERGVQTVDFRRVTLSGEEVRGVGIGKEKKK